MLNHSASLSLRMSTRVFKALPGKLDIKNTHLVFSIHLTVIIIDDIENLTCVLMYF